MSTNSVPAKDALDIPLLLDPSVGSQSHQVHTALREAILNGRLAAGLRLPSTRALAAQINVRRNAVVVAYENLQSDGLVESRVGSGSFVACRLPTPVKEAAVSELPVTTGFRGAFALGQTFADPDLLQRLAAALRRRILNADGVALGYGMDPRGTRVLREAVASNLAATRGIRCEPERVIIVGSVQQAIRLCAQSLMRPGDHVWFEDPGYPFARRALEGSGLRLVPVPVDEHGIMVEAGRRRAHAAQAAYVTPSMQFPTGATMTMERRLALVEWARQTGAWIFEDDYDNEFRYEGPPLMALAGIGGDRVIYLGTFSKMLFAGLRLGFVVLPSYAMERVMQLRAAEDRFPPVLMEQAVADLFNNGTVSAHTRRMRKRYRDARHALHAALSAAAGDALRIIVPTHGLHILAELPPGLPADAASTIRAQAGVEAWLVSDMRNTPKDGDAFVLGFAGHEIVQLVKAAERLGRVARDYVNRTLGRPTFR